MSTINLNSYAFASQLIDRELMGGLTPFEFSVIRFILDRTIAHGEEWRAIPVRHFLEGGWEDGGKMRAFGRLHMSRRTLINCIASLAEVNFIRVEKTRPHPRYALGSFLILSVE